MLPIYDILIIFVKIQQKIFEMVYRLHCFLMRLTALATFQAHYGYLQTTITYYRISSRGQTMPQQRLKMDDNFWNQPQLRSKCDITFSVTVPGIWHGYISK